MDGVVAVGLRLDNQPGPEGAHAPDRAVIEYDLLDPPIATVVQGIPDRDPIVGSVEGQDQIVLDTVAVLGGSAHHHVVRRVTVDQQAIGVVATAIGDVVRAVAAGEHIGVRPILAQQPVVVQAADQRVVAVAAIEVVVAGAAVDLLAQHAASQVVVACRPVLDGHQGGAGDHVVGIQAQGGDLGPDGVEIGVGG